MKSTFSRLASFWVRLRTIFREIFPTFPSALPFLHSVNAFPIRASLILHALLHLYLPIYSPSAPHSPRPSPPSPTFFLIPPHPINARSRAPSRNTRVRLHIPTRQEVFVFCLHRFTHLPQSAVHQYIRCEGKREKAFTKYTTISKSTSYHKCPISSTVNFI